MLFFLLNLNKILTFILISLFVFFLMHAAFKALFSLQFNIAFIYFIFI